MAEETIVIFRRWPKSEGGDVVALFPYVPADNEGAMCSSYMRVGQHGSADPYGVVSGTKPTVPTEYAELKNELESAPYNYQLKVVQRIPGDVGPAEVRH